MPKIEKKLKVLYLITKSNFGGAQRYVHDLARYAHDEGHSVAVAMGGDGPLKQKLDEAGVRTIAIPSLGRDVRVTSDIATFFRLIRLIRDERPDIVHLNSSKMGALGALASRFANAALRGRSLFDPSAQPTRIIFTGHGWAFNEERGDLERFVIGALHWLTIILADKTIAVSRKTRLQIARLPLVDSRLSVVHNGIADIALKMRDDALRTLLGDRATSLLAENPLVVGTLAELHPNKGIRYAIEGLAQAAKTSSRPLMFVVLGEGEERPLLEQLIRERGLANNVFLLGLRESGMEYLSAFDIFLLPSVTEAFPYAILEAGNAGLPVIATAVGGIPEVIDDMESGILIQSKNPNEVARAILYLAENDERRKEFGRVLRARIRGKFNVETMARETLRLYHAENV